MQILQQILFLLLTIAAIVLFYRKIRQIRKNIFLGRDKTINDQTKLRWRNVFILAFGQKKLFRKPIVGLLHFFVYAGFVIINIEILEIIIDGLLGTHRVFAGFLGRLYNLLINTFEILAVLVIIACAAFLVRRNLIRLQRFSSRDLDGWPRSDANIILFVEIALMSAFLKMNASDTMLQVMGVAPYSQHLTGNFIISQWLHPFFQNYSTGTLLFIERFCWWFHITGIYAFLIYLSYSKHLHILLAFPNAYYASLDPPGKMENMPSVQNEVIYALQPELAPTDTTPPTQKFGAKDVTDLSWKNILDAYACTECGRCSAACPANQTGKLLSPRKIMMDTRDRAEELGNFKRKNDPDADDGKSLLHHYITEEELRACTTCNACVQECPVSINPLDIILQMRRYLIMEESNAPQEWNTMFSNVENNFAPWKFSPDDRDAWITDV